MLWLTAQVVLKSANKDDSNLAREIHHHRQFLHPHIARLYEVIVTENLVWLVLEYCPGEAFSRSQELSY
jgi:serine/threonine protein kinase